MADSNLLEGAHQTNILRLVDEFGEHHRETIVELYNSARRQAEERARISDFTPIFTYREAKEAVAEFVSSQPTPSPF